MPIIATAGHVDHGKSTLVLALTGIDPDRLEEEKRRGLTIDLGFAFFTTPAGRQVGIVDVPGHERFIKNMLAGLGAIDLNLFIVAANEGWKPQSQEHLDIMDLLQVRRAIVVITKVDLVPPERVHAVRAEVAEKIRGTSLEWSPVLEISAVKRRGLEELVAEIDRVLAGTPPPERWRLRMWIDRSFTIKGSGTVVTGTLTGETLRLGQEVEILPGGRRARIRTIQSHNQEVGFVEPNTRTALNLAGVERTTVKRGDALTLPGYWRSTDRLLAYLRFLEGDFEPRAGSGYKLHVGSAEIEASVRFLGGRPAAGESADALVLLEHPTTIEFGDRFILRDTGRHQTVGGGSVLEAAPAGRSPKALFAAAAARRTASGREAYLAILLGEYGYLRFDDVLAKTGLDPRDVQPESTLTLGEFLVSKPWFDSAAETINKHLRAYQTAHPVDAGIPLTVLRRELDVEEGALDAVLDELQRAGAVTFDSAAVRTSDFKPETVGPEQQKLLDLVKEGGASPPTIAELNQQFGASLVRALVRSGDLVQVNPFVFSSEFVEELKRTIVSRAENGGPFTVADFRDLVGTTRKYAVPLLEYLDQIGFTARRGDVRVLGPKSG